MLEVKIAIYGTIFLIEFKFLAMKTPVKILL